MTRFAGEKVDLSTYMNAGADFGKLGNLGQESRSTLKKAGINAAADVAKAGMNSYGTVMSGKFGADATIAAGKAKAGAIESKGMWDMIGSIGGGLVGGMGKWGGGAKPENPADWMKQQDTSNFTPGQVTEWNRAMEQEGNLFNQNNPGKW